MKSLHMLDYGVGNIGSLQALLENLGYIGILTSDPATVRTCPLLLLPGVGSAATALRELEARDLIAPLIERHAASRPVLGICLGGQLLFGFLEEAGGPGLGYWPGTVAALAGPVHFNTGWCKLDWHALQATGLSKGLRAEDTYFFNHQYVFPKIDVAHKVPVSDRPEIPAIYLFGSLCGIQFHPEKSQAQGRRLMKNVLLYFHGL